MTAQSDLSEQQWNALVAAPLAMFFLVARADNGPSKYALAYLATVAGHHQATSADETLLVDVLSTLGTRLEEMTFNVTVEAGRGISFQHMLATASEILDARCGQAESLAFKRVLIAIGTGTATSARLLSRKVSPAAAWAINEGSLALGLDA
jgi:hypothetical protein